MSAVWPAIPLLAYIIFFAAIVLPILYFFKVYRDELADGPATATEMTAQPRAVDQEAQPTPVA